MDNLQHQRFELKYLIHEQTAQAVRDFVNSYLVLDPFGAPNADFSYPVHSLYLDSDDLEFYWQTINGNKNRYKLRVRYYEDKPGSPVFFEIKRRMNNAILKERGAVKREFAEALLAGQLPDWNQLATNGLYQISALENFCRLMQHDFARPKAHVAYRREAWVSEHDNSVRVTMDRQIQFAFDPETLFSTTMRNPQIVFPRNVVLELKFTGRFPNWFAELVRHFNLWQTSAAKYVDGVMLSTEPNADAATFAPVPSPEMATKLNSRREIVKRHQHEIEPALA
jgi:SPX domain protein involved in polyphosphate accumulation